MQTTNSLLSSPTSVDPGALHSFRAAAEIDLAVIRSGILVYLQEPQFVDDLETPVRLLKELQLKAQAERSEDTAARLKECERTLTGILDGKSSAREQRARHALDLIAEIEASLLQVPLHDDLDFNISGFLDESFERLTEGRDIFEDEAQAEEEFEIDEETMEIFREEAAELLENISANLKTLTSRPDDRDALWTIRRCAHTFKGAAGVIGLKEASSLAHRVEDLLDRLAENHHEVTSSLIDLLTASTDHLNSMTLGCGSVEHVKSLAAIYAEFDRAVSGENAEPRDLRSDKPLGPAIAASDKRHLDPVKPAPAPIVRVELDKLDELLDLVRDLSKKSTAMDEQAKSQQMLTNRIYEKLLRLRMVRFGTLKTRLNRTVHVTCQEENKKADFSIDNEDFEIDTQILDSLVEPLLHLLRNAVVHGIESAERRRLTGKPEKGQIQIRVAAGTGEIVIAVVDDGRGISAAQLREKAVSVGLMEAAAVDALTGEEAVDLIFSRGLTTADKLSLNAGRGVGMSIVKESIGSMGGSISIDSTPQKGTTFLIRIPIALNAANAHINVPIPQMIERENVRDILIIDDSSSVRQMIKRLVENAGWKGITATDGLNAVKFLSAAEYLPNLILTDLEMPNLNGYELLEMLKNDDELRKIPVVMITSRTDPEHRQKALELGAAEFVTKPFDGNVLITIIEQLCATAEIA